MTCNLSTYELFIIKKLIYDNPRWCNKHINRENLTRNVPGDKRGECKEAVDTLVRKGLVRLYKSQGREDICVPKQYKYTLIGYLKSHREDHYFLQSLDFDRIR